jgi:hypothetical protein
MEKTREIRGELAYVVRSASGAVVENVRDPNMIMTLGRMAVARLFAGDFTCAAFGVGVGEGATDPSAEQTELTNPFIKSATRVGFTSSEETDGVIAWNPSDEPTTNARLDFVFDTEDANGMSIREFGLYCADGTLFARRVRGNGRAIEKDDDLVIEGYWIIRF